MVLPGKNGVPSINQTKEQEGPCMGLATLVTKTGRRKENREHIHLTNCTYNFCYSQFSLIAFTHPSSNLVEMCKQFAFKIGKEAPHCVEKNSMKVKIMFWRELAINADVCLVMIVYIDPNDVFSSHHRIGRALENGCVWQQRMREKIREDEKV